MEESSPGLDTPPTPESEEKPPPKKKAAAKRKTSAKKKAAPKAKSAKKKTAAAVEAPPSDEAATPPKQAPEPEPAPESPTEPKAEDQAADRTPPREDGDEDSRKILPGSRGAGAGAARIDLTTRTPTDLGKTVRGTTTIAMTMAARPMMGDATKNQKTESAIESEGGTGTEIAIETAIPKDLPSR